jgi:hypothetical protein
MPLRREELQRHHAGQKALSARHHLPLHKAATMRQQIGRLGRPIAYLPAWRGSIDNSPAQTLCGYIEFAARDTI